MASRWRHDAVVRATGALTVDTNGAFSLNEALPRAMKLGNSQLHVIAEDARGAPLAAATLVCPV